MQRPFVKGRNLSKKYCRANGEIEAGGVRGGFAIFFRGRIDPTGRKYPPCTIRGRGMHRKRNPIAVTAEGEEPGRFAVSTKAKRPKTVMKGPGRHDESARFSTNAGSLFFQTKMTGTAVRRRSVNILEFRRRQNCRRLKSKIYGRLAGRSASFPFMRAVCKAFRRLSSALASWNCALFAGTGGKSP